MKPVQVPHVKTKYRRIVTAIPAPESEPLLAKLRTYEPRSVATQVPVVWDRAEGFQVYDPYGNYWIDFTSGIVVTNTGHAHPHVVVALRQQIERPLLHNYLFPSEIRARLAEKLITITPANLEKVFLLSSGSEAIECGIKLVRLNGLQKTPQKTLRISFDGSFHGRTMGSQQLCSSEAHKQWINPDPDIHQMPFPRC